MLTIVNLYLMPYIAKSLYHIIAEVVVTMKSLAVVRFHMAAY